MTTVKIFDLPALMTPVDGVDVFPLVHVADDSTYGVTMDQANGLLLGQQNFFTERQRVRAPSGTVSLLVEGATGNVAHLQDWSDGVSGSPSGILSTQAIAINAAPGGLFNVVATFNDLGNQVAVIAIESSGSNATFEYYGPGSELTLRSNGGAGTIKAFAGQFGVFDGGNNIRFLANSSGNIGLCSGQDFGSGVGVVSIKDRLTPPSVNPAGGGVLYSEGGALKWMGSAGTITVIAPA